VEERLGVTTEILIEPSDATLGNFEWRLSMARIDAAGPSRAFRISIGCWSCSKGASIWKSKGVRPLRSHLTMHPSDSR